MSQIKNTRSSRSKKRTGKPVNLSSRMRRGEFLSSSVVQYNSNLRKSPQSTHESIGEVPGSTAFAVAFSQAINPALSDFSIWSDRTKTYERYDGRYLKLNWVPSAAGTYKGLIFLCWDYDTLDSSPTTLNQATQASIVGRGKASEPFSVSVPIDHLKGLYTRTGSVVGADLKTYDLGKLHVCTYACDDTTNIGYVEMDAEVVCYEQNPNASSGSPAVSSLALWRADAFDTVSADTPFEFDTEVVNSYGITEASGVFTLPSGNWLIKAQLTCDAAEIIELWIDGVTSDYAAECSAAAQSVLLMGFVISDGTTVCSIRPTTSASIRAKEATLTFQMV